MAPAAVAVLDATTGIPSMINDVQTIFSGNASTLDKIMAGGDILLNVAMDVSMVVGVGEGLRVAYVGAKVAGHVAMDVGEHAIEHAGEDAVEHVAEHEAEDMAEHVGESCALSFAASTLVLTPSGERAIASLKAGDAVTAYDPATGTSSRQVVEATSIHHDANLVDVTLAVTTPTTPTTVATAAGKAPAKTPTTATTTTTTRTEVVHTTANHPWLSADHGWLTTSFLRVGEPVVRADGGTATVLAVRSVAGAAEMWDLTVSALHDFAVGVGAFVVHNCGGLPDGAPDGWEREDDTLTTGETRSWFSRGTAGVDRLEISIDHESGKMGVGWIDDEGGSALRRHLPGLLDWAGDSVKSIEGYASDGLLRHAETASGRRAITRLADGMLGSRGFSGGLAQEGERWVFRFSRMN